MSQTLHFNGLNATTGAPLVPAMSPDQLAAWIKGTNQDEDPALIAALATVRELRLEAGKHGVLGLVEGKSALSLEESRWGVIYHPNTPPEVRNHLKQLVDARNGTEYTYVPNETSRQFRARFGQGAGAVDPKKLPYYLMIAASPSEISFKFQYGLDAEHAVGRLHFDDPAGYASYVTHLLSYESTTSKLPRERRLIVFAPENPGDDATAYSATELAAPLAKAIDNQQLDFVGGKSLVYRADQITGNAATKPGLLDALTRANKQPGLLFAATHGLGFPATHARQAEHQGALVCAEWPGPTTWGDPHEIPESMYFSGTHLPQDANLEGLVVFAFACYSAGTPRLDDFSYFKKQKPAEISATPFVANLAQRLLSQGALAFIGHVERAWDYSFLSVGVGRDIVTFQSTIEAILKGKPIGHAFEYFNDRYTDLARELTDSYEDSLLNQYGLGEVGAIDLVSAWMAHNDARAYVLIGDPWAALRPELMAEASDQ